MKRSLMDYPLAGKRVLVRVDFNVPLDGEQVADDTRIRAALPTLQYLLGQNCALVLMSHLGRPRGEVVPGLCMAPVAARLAELIGRPVATVDDCVGAQVQAAAAALAPGDILLLENLRFHSEETANDPAFAAQLASLAEVFVNDAFGSAHRAHASTEGVTHYLPAVAGLLMLRELQMLGSLLTDPARPFVVVLGGAKVSDKIGVIAKMLASADAILVGGAMCFAFLSAAGHEIGRSKLEDGSPAVAAGIAAKAALSSCDFELPTDIVVAPRAEAGAPQHVVPADALPADEMGLDIGPATSAAFAARIAVAATVFWNGPMGLFEIDDFAAGTRAVGEAIAASAAVSVVGGGDTVSAVHRFGLEGRLDHVSTGGGASMEFIEGKPLPGVEALLDEESA
ncbi:MAG: phosphoglycerate kinase [Thermoleophilia bacterium]